MAALKIDFNTIGIKSFTGDMAGKVRSALVLVPKTYKASSSKVLFYFKGQEAKVDKMNSLFSALAEKYQTAIVFPQALPDQKGKENFDILTPSASNKDFQFFKILAQQIPLDSKISLAGSSTGGCFVLYLMSAEYYYLPAATFAASVWSGLLPFSANMFAAHGKLDKTVPYLGGKAHGVTFHPAVNSIKILSPIGSDPVITRLPGADLTRYADARRTAQLIAADGIGHAVLTAYKGVNLLEEMFKFFESKL